MQIFNTLTRQKEEFVPQVPGEYRIYVCGPHRLQLYPHRQRPPAHRLRHPAPLP